MSKLELGSKRIDPETGRKFYDLNKDPIVSPYTGKSYPRSFFEDSTDKNSDTHNEDQTDVSPMDEDSVLIPLEDADGDGSDGVHLSDIDDDDVFLEEEKETDDDVSDIIGLSDDEDL